MSSWMTPRVGDMSLAGHTHPLCPTTTARQKQAGSAIQAEDGRTPVLSNIG